MCRARILCQDKHGDVFRYTIEEPRSIANPYATNNKAVVLHPAQGSREATPSNSNEALSDVTVHSAKDGAKGGKKRCMQHPQGATITIDHDDGNYEKAGSSSIGCVRRGCL
jgi:hypothetical protein